MVAVEDANAGAGVGAGAGAGAVDELETKASVASSMTQLQDSAREAFLRDARSDVRLFISTAAFAMAQSLVANAYDCLEAEVGFATKGHLSTDEHESKRAESQHYSLLYGEVLPTGVDKIMDRYHLHAGRRRNLADLGAGSGKLCLQSFLQFETLEEVLGVELSASRFAIGYNALLNLASLFPGVFNVESAEENSSITISCMGAIRRRLTLRCGDLFNYASAISKFHIVVLETSFPEETFGRLLNLVQKMRRGTRLLSYMNLESIALRMYHTISESSHVTDPDYGNGKPIILTLPVKRMPINCGQQDTFSVSWNVEPGHHFHLWIREDVELSDYVIPSTILAIQATYRRDPSFSMSKFPQQPAQGVVQAQAVPVLVGQQPGQTVVMNNGVAAPGNVNIVMSPGMQQQPGQHYTVTVVQNQRQVEDTSGRDTQLIIMLVGCFCFPPVFLMVPVRVQLLPVLKVIRIPTEVEDSTILSKIQ
eukprot:g4705.t1